MKTFELTLEDAQFVFASLHTHPIDGKEILMEQLSEFIDSEKPGWTACFAYVMNCPFGAPETKQQALYSMSQIAKEFGMTEGALIKACVDNGLLNDVLKSS